MNSGEAEENFKILGKHQTKPMSNYLISSLEIYISYLFNSYL